MNLKSPPEPRMEGFRIGVLKGRLSDAIFVTRSGGRIYETNHTSLTNGLTELVEGVKNDKISGFFLDTFTYMHVIRHSEETNLSEEVLRFIHNGSKATEIEFPGEKKERTIYGVLVKDKDFYEFLRFAIFDHKEEFDMCERWGLSITKTAPKTSNGLNGLFAPSGEYFWPLFIGNMVVIAVILCFGGIFEVIQYKKKMKKTDEIGVNGFNNFASAPDMRGNTSHG